MPKKYLITSDLHLEFRDGKEEAYWKEWPSFEDIDTCICAGDLTSFGRSYARVKTHFEGLCSRFKHVIYVPGNHEYYGSDPDTVTRRLDQLVTEITNLHVLSVGNPTIIDGQRFLGDTMWFPDRPEVHMYRRFINDSFQIKHLFPWAFQQSALFLSYLRENATPDDIVVTHHVPTEVDTPEHWRTSPTQPYFWNRDCQRYLEDVNAVKPKAWIYGHTHDYHNYTEHGVRFICNPLGYPGERSRAVSTILEREWSVHEL